MASLTPATASRLLVALLAFACRSPLAQNSLPEWSPDGSAILFQSARSGKLDLYLMKPDGSGQRNLSRHPATDMHPAWSPDGQWIYFDSDRDGDFDVYRIRPDGGGLEQVTDHPGRDLVARPANGMILFNSDRDGDWELYRADPDGCNVVQLTHNEATDIARDWSGDLTRIPFDSDRDSDGNRQVYLLDAASGVTTRLTNDRHDNRFVRNGPPGSGALAFTSDRSGSRGIWILTPGGEPVVLYDGPEGDAFPSWSPDGHYVAFESERNGVKQIHRMDTSSGKVCQLTGVDGRMHDRCDRPDPEAPPLAR